MDSDAIAKGFLNIALESSSLGKRRILRDLYTQHGDDIKTILAATYDPYQRYYMTKGFVSGEGEGQLNREFFNMLIRLAAGQLSGDVAKYTVRAYLKTLTSESAALAVLIIKKDLRIGMAAESINKVFPGLIPQHKVMLAKPIEWHRVKYPCWSTIKLDGVRAIYRSGKFYFRNGKEIRGLQTLIGHLEGAPMLDGELVCPGMTFQESSGHIRAHAPTNDVEFHIIDVPEHSHAEFVVRMLYAEQFKSDRVHLIPMTSVCSKANIEHEYEKALAAGYEGLVIKPPVYAYQNKRSYSWMKIKQTETLDVRVIGIFEGDGKYIGMLGGVIVEVGDVFVKVGSGFSDAERYVYWNAPAKIIDKIIEVHYHEKTPDGSLRHPRFKRLRLDK